MSFEGVSARPWAT